MRHRGYVCVVLNKGTGGGEGAVFYTLLSLMIYNCVIKL